VSSDERVRSHMPLVRSIARRYVGRGEELDDLVQAGAVGLVRASSRFDPNRGVAFASFATPAVEGEIARHLRARSRRDVPGDAGGTDGAGEPAGDLEPTAESEARLLLAGGLRTLDQRERQVVFLRFNADMTERQIASRVGISQAHVSRLLDGALIKLRTELSGSGQAAAGAGSDGETPADETAVAASASSRRRPPRSRSPTGYSGRILVRMPSELHEQLALAAEREELSLNRYVTQALSSTIDPGQRSLRRSSRTSRLAIAANLAIVIVAAIAAAVLLVLALHRGL